MDHYYDSISIAMNSIAMALLFNSSRFVCIFAVVSGPMIFNMQLLINHYLKQEPRVVGTEAQFLCSCMQFITAYLFHYGYLSIIRYCSYISAIASMFVLIKYYTLFIPKFLSDPIILNQLFMFQLSYISICLSYWYGWLSTFELCVCGVYISWDLNGQIVTHDVVKEILPLFKPYYLLIPIGVIIEYYYFNPLVWMVDSRNNIHLTTLIFVGIFMSVKNIRHYAMMKNKLLLKMAEREKCKFSALSG